MAYKLLNIPNDDTQNYPSCRLQFVVGTFGHLTKPTNQNLLKTPKMLSQRLRKDYQNHLGTSVINSPLSPSFLLILQLYSGKIFWVILIFTRGCISIFQSNFKNIALKKYIWFQFKFGRSAFYLFTQTKFTYLYKVFRCRKRKCCYIYWSVHLNVFSSVENLRLT